MWKSKTGMSSSLGKLARGSQGASEGGMESTRNFLSEGQYAHEDNPNCEVSQPPHPRGCGAVSEQLSRTPRDSAVEVKGLLQEELEEVVLGMGLERYRAGQIAAWMYNRGTTDFGHMTDLSRPVREQLSDQATILRLDILTETVSADAQTRKYLFRLPDGNSVESVLMREGRRRTLCISSQVGCPLACRFCATGRMGLVRNLSAAEIVDQLVSVRRVLNAGGDEVTNVVFMGMGEPLLNYDEVVQAIRVLNLDYGAAIGLRRMTLSTVGHVPGILRLAREGLRVGLAVSLNATTDEQRGELMPVNSRWPIAEVLGAVSAYQRRLRRRVTFEYVLLEGVNDSVADARRLSAIAHRVPSKVNVIPWNPVAGAPYRRPSEEAIVRFVEHLAAACVTATVRYSKGTDISAACGQLHQQMDAPDAVRGTD